MHSGNFAKIRRERAIRKFMHLKKLQEFSEVNDQNLFPCIIDLVVNGVNPDRFSTEDRRPDRQDITQHLASWFKYIEVPSDLCKVWMNEYCVDMLAAISSSSKSTIRHSTKSNIKYIYSSNVIFRCARENNPFKASCNPNCSVYESSGAEETKKVHNEPKESEETSNPLDFLLLRDRYKDQFNVAMDFVNDNIKKGVTQKKIVALLNKNGFKSRTGKIWTFSTLSSELRRYRENNRDAVKVYDIKPEILHRKDNEKIPNPGDSLLMRDKYRNQFNEAMDIVNDNVKRGVKQKHIVDFLNNKGFRTRTGKKWTSSILSVELKRFNKE